MSYLVVPAVVLAQSTSLASHSAAPTIHAAHLTGSITLDGKLDEPAWAAATPATKFTQYDPQEGAAPTERTEVRVLVGGGALWIGARLYVRNPAHMRPRLTRRDEPVDGDIFVVIFDPRHDHLSGYYFRVSAGGALRDAVGTNFENLDLSWDAVWDAKVQRDSLGWTVEMRVPLSQLPYERHGEGVWGIQFERLDWNTQENDVFAFTPKREQGGSQRFGHLLGMTELPSPGRLELLPYATSRAALRTATPGDPFHSGHELTGGAGADLRLRPSSNLILNATVNPDFGQVEVDPAVVNLTAFETFFPEKRPFFVEGQDQFRFGTLHSFNPVGEPTLFFSRRIGRAPQGSVDNALFADVPVQTTIVTAAKLTGKTPSGWSLGLLDAVTARETARAVGLDGARSSTHVEPLTNYFVGRVRRESGHGNTQVGAFGSAVNRDVAGSPLDPLLRSRAYVGGVDLNHAWNSQRWALDLSLAGSRVEGSTGAIAATQTASRRYYNRPDARSFRFDSIRTRLEGYMLQAALTRTAGTHWLGNLAFQGVSPGFEVNDLGFQTNADRRVLSTDLIYRETQPGRLLRSYRLELTGNHFWNSDGNLVSPNLAADAFLEFHDFAIMFLRAGRVGTALNDRLTRGGPLVRVPGAWNFSASYFGDRRKHYLLQGDLQLTTGRVNPGIGGDLQLSVQPSPTFSFVLGPAFSWSKTSAQYLSTTADSLATGTYGHRYVFAELVQRQLALVTRINWTFTPRLSFQLFAQPLLAAGRYQQFKQLTTPRSFDFSVYGRDLGTLQRGNGMVSIDPDGQAGTANTISFEEPNFSLRSLRGNAVLRWEYRPGSTLFLVWQQQRQDSEAFGDLELGRDLRALFRAAGENVLAVKASFWIAR
ncbi:MAG TPA: DUF5916 domain-containing protein [Gemmatimonadales bacterium]|nr:DUF5916 domain-containing protein [Gemmatimonadales bacterium]